MNDGTLVLTLFLLFGIIVLLASFPGANQEALRLRALCTEKGGIYITDTDRLFGTCYDKRAIIDLK